MSGQQNIAATQTCQDFNKTQLNDNPKHDNVQLNVKNIKCHQTSFWKTKMLPNRKPQTICTTTLQTKQPRSASCTKRTCNWMRKPQTNCHQWNALMFSNMLAAENFLGCSIPRQMRRHISRAPSRGKCDTSHLRTSVPRQMRNHIWGAPSRGKCDVTFEGPRPEANATSHLNLLE